MTNEELKRRTKEILEVTKAFTAFREAQKSGNNEEEKETEREENDS